MAIYTSSVTPWTLKIPAGSLQEWVLTLTSPQGSSPALPYPVDGASWEYVVRPSARDLETPLVDITDSAGFAGLITVTSTSSASQVLLSVYPAATAGLSGFYAHALWMNPGTPSALAIAEGTLQVIASPQP